VRLVLWVALGLIVSLSLRRRPTLTICLVLAVWTIVPGVVTGQLTGHTSGSLSLHVGSWLILTTFLTALFTDPGALGEALVRRFVAFIAVLLVIAAAVLETKTGTASHGVVLAVDEMAAPFLAFWVLAAALIRRPGDALVLRNTIVALATGEAVFAIVQYAANNVILYNTDYLTRYWYKPGWNRWMGTTDHPLVLSLLICGAIPLLVGLRRRWLQPVLLVVLLIAVVITQSRSGAIAAAIGAMYVVLASRTSTVRKVALISVMAVAGALIATSSLSSGIVDRINNDTGSALARGSAWSYFADNWTHYLWTGGGITSNYLVAAEGGLDTSFESAFLMYSIDLGLLLAVAYFAVQFALALRGPRTRAPGSRMAAVLLLLLCQTFNSLEVTSLAGPLIWIVLALASSAGPAPDAQTPPVPARAARPGYSPATRARTSAAV
jgi:hypothetical protein